MILVTGGAGYVGSVLVRELLALGERVRVVDTLWFGNPFPPHDRLEVIAGDLRRPEPAWLDEVEAIVHLAGLSNDPTADFAPATADEANVTAMTEDMPIAPTANYSKTKRLAEVELLRIADQNPLFVPVLLRKGTIFGLGPRMRFDLVVNVFTLHAWKNQQLTVHGHGEAWRPLLHIRDAADAYIHLLSAPVDKIRGEAFNLVHKNYRVLELAHWVAEVIEQRYGVEVRVKRDRSTNAGARSYYVSGAKIQRTLGFSADRGASEAVVAIWDALERGDFGLEPDKDPRFFNIRWLKETVLARVPA